VTTGDSIVDREIDAGDGLTIHLAKSGSGPPLVLLHGFTGSTETWMPLRPKFDHAYRVIAIDQPGHGRTASPSDPSRYDLDRFATDLAAVLDSMSIDRVVMLGYSMGGRAALRFAVDHPDRVAGLVLESTSSGIVDAIQRSERRASDSALADDIERDGIEAFVQRWERLPLWDTQHRLPDSARNQLHQQRLSNNPLGLANSLRGAGAGEEGGMLDAAGGIRAPTLLIAGALDSKYVELGKLLGSSIPDSRLEIVAGSGHTVHLEQPDAFASAIMDFLSTIPSADGRWT
jgi:2-succinyl-6-hydroxy-2,4-cyclohexadiene-1-carboxylate synthase